MDVSKAKTVIIVLLAAFNIFMFVSNLTFNDAQSVSKETLKNAEMILEQRGITFECEIPVKAGGSHRLEYDKAGLDRESIAAGLLDEGYESRDDSVYFDSGREIVFSGDTKFVYTDIADVSAATADTDKNKASEAAYKFMEARGLIDGKYVLDKFEMKDDRSSVLYFIEKYEDQLLFDNYFLIELSDNRVMRLEYQKHKIKGFSVENIEQPEVYQTLLSYFKKNREM
jgi:regulatory protein YycI of two-component signal transduction system YycFG